MKQKALSGIKPTGRPHIGNYFGMLRQLIDMQHTYATTFFIADYHALNFIQDKGTMKQSILDVALDLLALGFDPHTSTLFKQSDVPEHGELTWIFDTITTMPYLMRAHAYKDAQAKNNEINVGTFNYPMLMATDILMYDIDIVPVGQDQKQHVEYARDTAQKFNSTFGKEVFVLPQAHIVESVSVVPGTDGRKMSKSYNNTIPLFATPEEIKKAVMSIPTDSKAVEDPKDPDTDNVFALYTLFASPENTDALKERYTKGGIGYKEAKEMLIAEIESFIGPLREKRAQFEHDTDYVLDIVREGGLVMREKAQKKMEVVRDIIGVKLY
jgi:tryptophanyl-tRNA synthetase